MKKKTPLADSLQQKNKLERFKNDRKSSFIVVQISQTELAQSFSKIPCPSTHFAVLIPQTVWTYSLPCKQKNPIQQTYSKTSFPNYTENLKYSAITRKPGVNVQVHVEAVINEVASEPTEVETEGARRGVERPVIPGPTTNTTPASEFTTPYFFTMAFPCLFPYGKGDFHINRPVTCPALHDWAEHLLWYQDGRFARHKVWKFVVHNMIMRKRALEQSRFFVDQQLGDPQITVADLQEHLAGGDTSFTNKLLYFGANLRGTAQYWHQRRRELRALVEFMVNEKRGLPSFFMTGSCAEFYFPPLRRLLEQYILQTMRVEVNLAEDSNTRFKAVQENTHVVVSYFDLRTQSYHEKVLKPVFGVSDYWYRYEFAKSRGQIHWHQLSWRDDRQPHQLLHEAREDGCGHDEYAARLSQWADENFAMSALHHVPATKKDEDCGKTRYQWT